MKWAERIGLILCQFIFDHSIHTAAARAFVQRSLQFGVLRFIAYSYYFYMTGIRILHPAAQTADGLRFTMHEPAEAHSLHAAADLIVTDHENYARPRYEPSLVSTRIFSPSLMNGGT